MQDPTIRLQPRPLWASLKFKLILMSILLILISVTAMTIVFLQRQRSQIRGQLISRGESMTRLIAYNSRYGVQIADKPILQKIIGGITDDPDVVYCLIADKRGKIISHHNLRAAGMEKIRPQFSVRETGRMQYTNPLGTDVINIASPVELETVDAEESEPDDFLGDDLGMLEEDDAESEGADEGASEAVAHPEGERRIIGSVQVGIGLETMKRAIADSMRRTLFISALIFLAGATLAFWIGSIITTPIQKVVSVLNNIIEGEGDLGQRVQIKSSDEVGDLARGFNTFMEKFQEIKKVSVFLNELAAGGGDLTKRLNISSGDEIGMLAQGFDRFTDQLHDVICQVAQNTEEIGQASQRVSDATARLARELGEMASLSTQVAQSSSEVSGALGSTSSNVAELSEMMNRAELLSGSGVDAVNENRNGMAQVASSIESSSLVVEKLSQSSQEIGKTVVSITEIADQTKLIAVNAAIEASRVGAEGKGFAVVAEEIRRLAARITKATAEISLRIQAVQTESAQVVVAMRQSMDEAKRGLALSDKSKSSLDDISQTVEGARSSVNNINIASNEQNSSMGLISQSIQSISEAAGACSTGVSDSAQSMHNLNREVQELRQLVSRFVIAPK